MHKHFVVSLDSGFTVPSTFLVSAFQLGCFTAEIGLETESFEIVGEKP